MDATPSAWLLAAQAAALALLLLALADAGLAVTSQLRRRRYEKASYRRRLEIVEERLRAARARRVDAESEQLPWNGLRKFEVAERRDEGAGITSFYLKPHDGKPIPSYRPGQYLTFSFRIPEEKNRVVRCYSLSDAPRPDHYRISVKLVGPPRDAPSAPPGKASSHLHGRIEPGDIIDVRAPRGDFYLDLDKTRPLVLAAGGVGMTPLLAMLNALVERGLDREVWFFFGVRNPSEYVMKDHLSQLAVTHAERLHLHVCLSDTDPSQLFDAAGGVYHCERVSVELFKRVLPSSNFEFYICGPPPMMDSLTRGLRAWGVPDEDVFFESFGPATVRKTPRAEQVSARARPDFKVRFGRSGVELAWDPAAETLLHLAEQNGVPIDSGCRAGSCGTCITAIKSGEVEYLTPPGEPPEAGSCLACIAVPRSDLVLDA